jgi:hypothetical protein
VVMAISKYCMSLIDDSHYTESYYFNPVETAGEYI